LNSFSFNTLLKSILFIKTKSNGQSSLGNKLYGNKSNVGNLTAYVIQNFQNTQVTPDRIVIAASGVENHQEFVDLVNEKMFFTQLPSKSAQRSQSTYVGG
jgi:predicted Zn-dependent peptidase